jgi:hypothetical protein
VLTTLFLLVVARPPPLDNVSQYETLSLSQLVESYYYPVGGDKALANNRMLYRLDYAPGKILVGFYHFLATSRLGITSPPVV